MKVNKWTLGLAAAGLVSLPLLVQAEEKASPVMTALSSTTISGYVDTSAHWNLGTGNDFEAPFLYNSGKSDGFNLNKVKLRIEKPLDEAQWAAGYRFDALFGPDANVFGSSSIGGTIQDFAIQQAYVALRAPVGNGLDFKMGVFDSIIGYESHDSVNNPNYTRSYAVSLEPHTHTGLLGTYQFNKSIGVSFGIANTLISPINSRSTRGTDEVGETYKSYMASVALTAPDDWGFLAGSTLYAGYLNGFGTGGTVGANSENQQNLYLGGTFNTPVKDLKVGFSYDYVSDPATLDTIQPITTTAVGQSPFTAIAGYVSYKMDKWGFNLRGEFADAYNGDLDPAAVGLDPSRQKFDVFALTGTVSYDLWKNVLTRLEMRWDHNADGFNSFGGTKIGADGLPIDGAADRMNAYLVAANVIYKF